MFCSSESTSSSALAAAPTVGSTSDTSPILSPPPLLDTPELANDDNDGSSSTEGSPLVETSKESPLSVASSSPDTSDLTNDSGGSSSESLSDAEISKESPISVASSSPDTSELSNDSISSITKGSIPDTKMLKESPTSVASISPDYAIVNEYSTSGDSSSPDSEISASSGVDTSSKTVSSFHVPEPPEDVSVLFMDETDCQDSNSVESSLIREWQPSMRVEQIRKSMVAFKFTDPHSSPTLNSSGDEEGGSPSRKETKSDSYSSEASPTLLYSCSSRKEGERERNTSLDTVNTDNSPSLSSEASGPRLSNEGEEDVEKVNTSPERITQVFLSTASQHLASGGEKQDSKMKSPPAHVLSLPDHSSSRSSDSENKTGDGRSIGVAEGNSSEAKAAGKKQEKVEEKEEDEGSAKPEPQFKVGYQYRTVERQLMQNEVSYTYTCCTHFNLEKIAAK